MVDRDGVIGEAEDSIEPARDIERYQRTMPGGTNLPKAKARPGSVNASAKSWPLMTRSPIVNVSWDTMPVMEPEP